LESCLHCEINDLVQEHVEGQETSTLPIWRLDRRAEAAAVNAIAKGSQDSTMSAISQRMARSLSVSAPTSSAT